MTDVYTDGACKRNPGPGGWGWVVPDGPWASGADPHTTNQRMELMAALDALRTLPGPVEVVSDSTYVVNCFNDGWWKGWLARGWKNSKKEPVANRDIWEPLIDLYRSREHEITFRWVKGHDGDEWNDVADRLAVEASETQRARSGTGIPPDLGPADDIGGTTMATGVEPTGGTYGPTWRPPGRSVAVLGLQPPALGGYEENQTAAEVRRMLGEILTAKHTLDPATVVLTGLRLGAETLAAEAARARGVPYAVVLPYPDPESKWPGPAQRHFADLRDDAAAVIQLERKSPESPARAGQAMDRRNAWIRQVADEAVIVWDRQERRVADVVRSFEKEMPDDVWIVEPPRGNSSGPT